MVSLQSTDGALSAVRCFAAYLIAMGQKIVLLHVQTRQLGVGIQVAEFEVIISQLLFCAGVECS